MTTTSPVSTASTSPSTSDESSAISNSQVSTTNLAGVTSQTSSVGTLAATSPYTSVAGDATSNDTNHSSPPYGAIIGGALGGVALLCLTVLAVFLIRRKNASSGHGPPSHPTAVAQAQGSYYANRLSSGKWYDHPYQKPQEISNDTAIYEAEANMDPAELPGR
ncbi:Syndecan domain containing protein [Teratosphaeria destructans]|uniref:Syndecan domain containing protein n=1 Tax=Teratosphaeria destructans TaxID=418781 RepID=A0A9W7T195_9PEZI|nr:Syndecan domain containing protein [Teratosphaeria destructans]